MIRFPIFDTQVLGINDPQGIEFNYLTHTLFIGGGSSGILVETDKNGSVIRIIDISSLNMIALSDLALGRISDGPPTTLSLYMTDRGVDDGEDPLENDGKIYEITLDDFNLNGIYLPMIFLDIKH
jgi:hypothetical protein